MRVRKRSWVENTNYRHNLHSLACALGVEKERDQYRRRMDDHVVVCIDSLRGLGRYVGSRCYRNQRLSKAIIESITYRITDHSGD